MSRTTILYKDVAPGADEDAAVSTGSAADFSVPQDLVTGVTTAPGMTCERNQWVLNGEHRYVSNLDIAFWSRDISGEDCTFDNPPVIDIGFDEQYSSVGLTLVFDTETGDYCTSVNIKWYQDQTLKASKDFTPDATTYFFRQQVESYNRIVITLNATSLPYRRAKINQIIFGIYRYFGMSELRSASIVNEMSLIGTELPISTMKWTLDSKDDVDLWSSSSSQ